jgi:hypothetical protein
MRPIPVSGFLILPLGLLFMLSACSSLRKASSHDFDSGPYSFQSGKQSPQPVYADITEEQVDLYHRVKGQIDRNRFITIPLRLSDTLPAEPVRLRKSSLDIDITTILLKYRPGVSGLQPQLTTDFNLAMYAGWRRDIYTIRHRTDPLGRTVRNLSSWGYDLGLFAGPGSTAITPFTTANRRNEEYSAMIIQTGLAAFIESSAVSFGLGIGVDHLMNADREVWIYRDKPWIGFFVGVAIN